MGEMQEEMGSSLFQPFKSLRFKIGLKN